MTKDEALKLALEALKQIDEAMPFPVAKLAQAAIKEALAQPAQKYRRGNRLICLETEEYCVIHISGTDRQWVKFPTSYIGVYTNEQVAELFELLPKEPKQEPMHPELRKMWEDYFDKCFRRKPLTDKQILADETLRYYFGQNGGAGPVSKQGRKVVNAIEALHEIKEVKSCGS